MKALHILSISVIFLFALTTSATEIPGGYVSGDWYASGNPYNINGEIIIQSGTALHIHEGVEVIFRGYHKLIVNGILDAVGTESDSILFTAEDTLTGWHSLRFINSQDTSRVSFCVIEYGRADGYVGDDDPNGGGICILNSHPVISNSTIRNNWSDWQGGGICCMETSNPIIRDCHVLNNYAFWTGGGISSIDDSSPYIFGCIIELNVADSGGGIMGAGFKPIISNSTIRNNSADHGGGVCDGGIKSSFINCAITDNEGESEGGGVWCASSPSFKNCLISGNSFSDGYGSGAGIYNYYAHAKFENCEIRGNYTDYRGGGICLDHSATVFSECTIRDNVANRGGGIEVFGEHNIPILRNCLIIANEAAEEGGGIRTGISRPLIINCTISSNIARSGGAIFCDVYWEFPYFPVIVNSILWANEPGEIAFSELDTIKITYSDICGGWEGVGNINIDPQFVNPSQGDYHLQSTTGSFHNGFWLPDPWHSPCIDAGEPEASFLFEPLPNGRRVNMGTYGNTEEASMSLILGTEPIDQNFPLKFILNSCYPNPFNPTTTFSFTLPKASNVTLVVYDVKGQHVATLVDGYRKAGTHEAVFDGKGLVSGIYIYRLTANQTSRSGATPTMLTGKMVLMK